MFFLAAAAVIWAAASELLFQSKEYTCFDITLKKLQEDPRVTVRLGTPVSGFGQDTRNRQARQRIPNRIYNDANGIEHVQASLKFLSRPSLPCFCFPPQPSFADNLTLICHQDDAAIFLS